MKKAPRPKSDSMAKKRLARREKRASDMLPYARHVDETTIATRDGSQMQVLHLVGFGFETADTQELNYRKNVRDAVLRGIASSRLTIGAYVIRHLVRPGLTGRFTNLFARNLDESGLTRASLGQANIELERPQHDKRHAGHETDILACAASHDPHHSVPIHRLHLTGRGSTRCKQTRFPCAGYTCTTHQGWGGPRQDLSSSGFVMVTTTLTSVFRFILHACTRSHPEHRVAAWQTIRPAHR